MSSHNILSVKKRSSTGTGAARACRNEGFIPGIVYGGQKDPEIITIDPKSLIKEIQKSNFYTHIYTLDVDGKSEPVLAKDVQFHPVTDQPMHIDFMRVTKGTKLNLHIPVNFINEDKAPGIKQGGALNIVHHTLEVIASADAIPDSFTVDLTGYEGGSSIRLTSITLPAGVVAAHPVRDNTLATITGKAAAVEEEKNA